MTNKDQISIDMKNIGGLEWEATQLIKNKILEKSVQLDHPRTIVALARMLVMEPRKLARWLKKLDINIHEC